MENTEAPKRDHLLVQLWPIDRRRLEQLAAEYRTSRAAVVRQLIREAAKKEGSE